jgi:cysteine desulfurase/selenocysteine lyase
MSFDVRAVRENFPILGVKVHDHPLVYLDNAATTQKTRGVIEAIEHYYGAINANIHRGVHELSRQATAAHDEARAKVRHFIGAASEREIIFVRGTTEAINLVAQSYGRNNIGLDDEIIVSEMEHHSNIVPWQILCEQTGAHLRVIPVTDSGELKIDEYKRLLGKRTKLVAITHVSNALGTINPIEEVISAAHAQGVPVLIDGAQAVAHLKVDVRALNCDFYAFSGHKLFGPTGIGVLYGKESFLKQMPPYQSGGDMIRSVSFSGTTYNELPFKFEAGTPDIAGAIGLGAAIDFIEGVGVEAIGKYEQGLLNSATEKLSRVSGLTILGTAPHKAAVVSFVINGIHPHDIGTVLDRQGIAIRTGHHCAQPLMARLGVPATARASFAFYNTAEEVDALVEGLAQVKEVFGHE